MGADLGRSLQPRPPLSLCLTQGSLSPAPSLSSLLPPPGYLDIFQRRVQFRFLLAARSGWAAGPVDKVRPGAEVFAGFPGITSRKSGCLLTCSEGHPVSFAENRLRERVRAVGRASPRPWKRLLMWGEPHKACRCSPLTSPGQRKSQPGPGGGPARLEGDSCTSHCVASSQ